MRVKDDYFSQLIEAGLDSLVVSLYGITPESYKQVHGYDGFERVQYNLALLSQANREAKNKMAVYIKVVGEKPLLSLGVQPRSENEMFNLKLKELGFQVAEWAYVHNYGDGRHYNQPNETKLCPVIHGARKNILNITWNLDVIPCCYDFNATIRFGNLRVQSLDEIFLSPEYFRFILAHRTQQLNDYPVCANCEKLDYI